MNSSGFFFALAYITVCYATGMEYFAPRTSFTAINVPAPDLPKVGTWSWPKKDSPCVMVQFAIQMNISYITAENTNLTNVLYNIPAEQTSVSDGLCSNDTQNIKIIWNENNQTNSTNSMTVEFWKNSSTTQFSLSSIKFDLILDNKTFPGCDFESVSFEHRKTEFTTPIDMSYHCTKPQHFNLTTTPVNSKMNATFVISHVQLEAFNVKNTNQFATAKDCDAIDTPDIVPIAVGCALAGLIVIVLIAYLVGRRRAQARGYLSM